MKLINGLSLLAAIILTCIFGECYTSYCNRTLSNGTVNCCTNFYFNGLICTECPAGFLGDNCVSLCPYPLYGVHCNETCDCSKPACHHAYGCKTTTLSSEYVTVDKRRHMQTTIKVCPDGFFGDNCSASCIFPQYGSLCNETCGCSNASCHHVYGCKTTIVTTSTTRTMNEETLKKRSYIKITIVFIGISLSAVLLFLIAREIYQLLRIHEICGNLQLPGGTPDEDNVYNEITLSSQDTS
ncbi:uncharacterized protein LOC111105804 isoform X3 [Crassostrea virginica]